MSHSDEKDQPYRERLLRLVCGCFEDNCPRRVVADEALAQAWDEGWESGRGDGEVWSNNPYSPPRFPPGSA